MPVRTEAQICARRCRIAAVSRAGVCPPPHAGGREGARRPDMLFICVARAPIAAGIPVRTSWYSA